MGPACQVIVGPGSYGGATVTIPAGRNNISIIGPSAGDLGGTIASLSSSRALTIGNNVVRARIVSLQIEGLTTVSTTGSGVHRFEQSQMVGGLTIGAISATIYVVGCSVGNVSVDAGFTGTLLFDRCLFVGTYTNGTLPTRVLMSDCAGLAAAPTGSAILNGRFQVASGVTTFYANGTALLGAPLTAINGLTPAADRIAYYTSASAASMTAITAFGRSLIDDVDAAAARTTLGLGTAATTAATAYQAAYAADVWSYEWANPSGSLPSGWALTESPNAATVTYPTVGTGTAIRIVTGTTSTGYLSRTFAELTTETEWEAQLEMLANTMGVNGQNYIVIRDGTKRHGVYPSATGHVIETTISDYGRATVAGTYYILTIQRTKGLMRFWHNGDHIETTLYTSMTADTSNAGQIRIGTASAGSGIVNEIRSFKIRFGAVNDKPPSVRFNGILQGSP